METACLFFDVKILDSKGEVSNQDADLGKAAVTYFKTNGAGNDDKNKIHMSVFKALSPP